MSAGLADVLLAINSDAPRDMWRQGVVTVVTGLTVTVQIGTAATPVTGITYFNGYDPQVGDVVHLLPYGSSFVVVGKLAQNTSLASYNPVWTGATTNPVIGNGTIVGAYRQIGKVVFFRVSITFGSTTTYGTGAYSISLPVPAVGGVPQTTGPGRFANGAGSYVAVLGVVGAGASTVQIWGPSSSTSSLQINVTSAAPFATLANGGGILIEGWYEAA